MQICISSCESSPTNYFADGTSDVDLIVRVHTYILCIYSNSMFLYQIDLVFVRFDYGINKNSVILLIFLIYKSKTGVNL